MDVTVGALVLVGRLLFVLFFLDSGINNLRMRDTVAERLRGPTMPSLIRRNAALFNLASAMLLIAGSAMIALGAWPDIGALFLALFLIPVTVMSHPFWKSADRAQRRQQLMSFLRNGTLLGGCVVLFAFFAAQPQISFTLTGPFFSLR